MVEIPVGKHHVALVDDEDAELVQKYKWKILRTKRGVYATTRITILMHRLVMGLQPGDLSLVADHKDGSTLDNRRKNLRTATRQQNVQNARKSIVKKKGASWTPYKGVVRDIRGEGRYNAYIKPPGHRRRLYLGYFRTAEEAAMAYNVAAKKHFGEFACLNEVDMG